VRISELVVPAGELDVEGLCKAVAEVVGRTRLQRHTVVHHGFDGVGGFRTGKLLLFSLLSLDYRDG